MSQMEIDRVMSQIRDLRVAGGAWTKRRSRPSSENNSTVSFASVLKQSIDQVNQQQQKPSRHGSGFERGSSGCRSPASNDRNAEVECFFSRSH